MTKEEALRLIKTQRIDGDDLHEAFDMAIKALEQEPILDKIRAEIIEEMLSHSGTGEETIQAYADGLKKGLDILDKYKAESEVEDGNDIHIR